MAWNHATLRLETPCCDAATKLAPGQRMRCLRPGTTARPLAHIDGDPLPGWAVVQDSREGGFQLGDEACAQCPARQLPSDMLALDVEATTAGLTLRVAYDAQASLAEAYHGFRATGQGPHVHRSSRQQATAPAAIVDLAGLTPRQRQALEVAANLGYFHEGSGAGVDALAATMGCSRSTAHEHLRKGLTVMLGDIFS